VADVELGMPVVIEADKGLVDLLAASDIEVLLAGNPILAEAEAISSNKGAENDLDLA
jgi:hypothetical protein